MNEISFVDFASATNQWRLHYLAIILNCNIEILHVVYVTVFQQLRFHDEVGKAQLFAELQRQITAVFFPGRWTYFPEVPEYTFEGSRWLTLYKEADFCSVTLWDENLDAGHILLLVEYQPHLQLFLSDEQRPLQKWHLPVLLSLAMEKRSKI